MQPGWIVEVYQPQALPVPAGPPTESFVVPNVTINATAGAAALTGNGPDGWSLMAMRGPSCFGMFPEFSDAKIVGGSFSATFRSPARGGDRYYATAISPTGDVVSSAETKVPGDGQCMIASTISTSGANDDQKYQVNTAGLDSAIPTTRMVLRRGATVIADENDDGLSLSSTQKPAAGDVVDVYRPQGAPTPAYSWTIPAVSATSDIASKLVAIDAPPASAVMASPCLPFTCQAEFLLYGPRTPNTGAGRTVIDLTEPSQWGQIMRNVTPDSVAIAGWVSPDESKFLFVDATPGDLTAPTGKITLAKSLKAKKLGKKALKFSLKSNEAGKAGYKLTIPGKSKKKPVTLASGKSSKIKTGTNKLSLKFSRGGKKALKQATKSKRKLKATLSVTLKDAAGNVSTVAKSVTIKP
jgi:hypothetical protein